MNRESISHVRDSRLYNLVVWTVTLVEKLVRAHSNLVQRESLDDTLHHLLPWDIDVYSYILFLIRWIVVVVSDICVFYQELCH